MTYQVLPPLSDDDYAALKADIAAHGVLIPVEYDEAGNVLDGHHRLKACDELGLKEWPRFVRRGLSEAEKLTHARQLNLARRHLSQAQKGALIKAQLIETPEVSDRQIARGLGVSPTTVGSVRKDLENGVQIGHHDMRVGKDGVRQPARKPIVTDFFSGTPAAKAFVQYNSGNNEWYTPPEILEAARQVLGGFDLDPASSLRANLAVRAKHFFTEADDGLVQDWPLGRIWMNPPYAQPLMAKFAARFAAEVARGSTGIVLVNNATETHWFHALGAASAAICFPLGRLRFLDVTGRSHGPPLQGQALFYAGPDVAGFAAAFGTVGLVARL